MRKLTKLEQAQALARRPRQAVAYEVREKMEPLEILKLMCARSPTLVPSVGGSSIERIGGPDVAHALSYHDDKLGAKMAIAIGCQSNRDRAEIESYLAAYLTRLENDRGRIPQLLQLALAASLAFEFELTCSLRRYLREAEEFAARAEENAPKKANKEMIRRHALTRFRSWHEAACREMFDRANAAADTAVKRLQNRC